MVDKEKLTTYISQLEDYLSQLSELQEYSKQEVTKDWRVYDLIDRKLQLSIENALNIGDMVISDQGFEKPDTYAEIFEVLYKNEILSEDLKDKLVELAKFRNVLVHGYIDLNHEIVYNKLQSAPDILKEFLTAIVDYINGE